MRPQRGIDAGKATRGRLPADAGVDYLIIELFRTQALLEHGVPEHRLVAVERTPVLADLLTQRFRAAKIITGDALNLSRLLRRHLKDELPILAVVSSLPLRHFSDAEARLLGPAGVSGGRAEVIALDRVRRLALVAVPEASSEGARPVALTDLQTPAYVVVAEGTRGGVAFRGSRAGGGSQDTAADVRRVR